MANNILLIGFMGVGKGRTARTLAERTGRFTLDTDDLIESYTNLKIRKIFAQRGEKYFRELEQLTADWLERRVGETVISTGGGFFKVNNLKRIGKVVYLHSDIEHILQGIMSHPNWKKKIKKRPLLQDMEQARALHAERLPLYRAVADFEINVQSGDIDKVVDTIIYLLEE